LPSWTRASRNSQVFPLLAACAACPAANDHGTQCASILAARSSAGSGVVGVAPEAHLYAVKVLDSSCEGDSVATLKGMYWAYREGMEVVSMSLAETDESCALEFYTRAVEVLNSVGCVVVAGAGNVMPDTNGTVRAPANSPGVIAVGSISEEGNMLEDSAFGVMLDCKNKASESLVLAPGINIMTLDKDGVEDGFGGTSAACPQVAGLVALLKCQFKDITPEDVVSKVTSSARKLSTGRLIYQSGPGAINCDLATRDVTVNQ
jgi:subtilisin